MFNENFAIKADLKETELRLDGKIDSLSQKLESSIKELEYKIAIKLSTIVSTSVDRPLPKVSCAKKYHYCHRNNRSRHDNPPQ